MGNFFCWMLGIGDDMDDIKENLAYLISTHNRHHDRISKLESLFDQATLRAVVGDAVESALDGKTDKNTLYYNNRDEVVKNKLVAVIRNATKETVEAHVKSHINSEQFIDDIIDRIKRKQIA